MRHALHKVLQSQWLRASRSETCMHAYNRWRRHTVCSAAAKLRMVYLGTPQVSFRTLPCACITQLTSPGCVGGC